MVSVVFFLLLCLLCLKHNVLCQISQISPLRTAVNEGNHDAVKAILEQSNDGINRAEDELSETPILHVQANSNIVVSTVSLFCLPIFLFLPFSRTLFLFFSLSIFLFSHSHELYFYFSLFHHAGWFEDTAAPCLLRRTHGHRPIPSPTSQCCRVNH